MTTREKKQTVRLASSLPRGCAASRLHGRQEACPTTGVQGPGRRAETTWRAPRVRVSWSAMLNRQN